MKTYSPISTNKEKTFELAEPTLKREKAIHELQCAYPGVSLAERKQICATHKWKPEHKIPEESHEVRIAVSALKKIVDRNSKKPAGSHEELKRLCSGFESKKTPIESIDSETYWTRLASIIFTDFELKQGEAGDLNFRVISEAYSDFFGT